MFAVRAALAVLAALGGPSLVGGDDGGGGGGGGGGGDITVGLTAMARDDQSVVSTPLLDRLTSGDVLDISMADGTAGAKGVARQCVRTLGGVTGCTNRYPVQFGDDGDARFQYQLTDPGDCGPGGSCVLVVDDLDGERRALAVLVFGGPAPPPPVVTISPTELVEEGDEVRVDIAGLQPESAVQVGYCDPECANATRVVSDARGQATATVIVGSPCARCGVAVIGSAHDTLTPVPFAPPRRADYDARRLTIGLLVAAGLLLAAWRIVTRIDWRPPSEADTPDLDLAEL
jgi:hypothetical protein